jgi:multidrug resistance efflux pump
MAKLEYNPLQLQSLEKVRTPKNSIGLMIFLMTLLVVFVVMLLFVPWQQTVSGSGKVTSFNVAARPQTIQAVINSRIVKWYVHEGDVIREGDTIALVRDINQNFMAEDFYKQIKELRDNTVNAQDRLIAQANQRVNQARERLFQAEASYKNSIEQYIINQRQKNRDDSLATKGLKSTREYENTFQRYQNSVQDTTLRKRSVIQAQQDIVIFQEELERIVSSANAIIAEVELRLANAKQRLDASVIRSPINGHVVRISSAGAGQTVKEGDILARIVPDTLDQAVELFVNSLDAAICYEGAKVTIQFSGFPAFQFSGLPDLGVGIFRGIVSVIDQADDGEGRFRLLVVPDQSKTKWPSRQYIRQGTEATGWVLLTTVPLGYELWRQFMGFPPLYPVKKPTIGVKQK